MGPKIEGGSFHSDRVALPKPLEFAGLMAYHRRVKGLLQKDVADLLDKSPSTISLWESGRRVPRERSVIEQLGTVFQLAPNELSALFNASGIEVPSIHSPETKMTVVGELNAFFADPEIPLEPKVAMVNFVKATLELARRK